VRETDGNIPKSIVINCHAEWHAIMLSDVIAVNDNTTVLNLIYRPRCYTLRTSSNGTTL